MYLKVLQILLQFGLPPSFFVYILCLDSDVFTKLKEEEKE